jgi:hypothetical protein
LMAVHVGQRPRRVHLETKHPVFPRNVRTHFDQLSYAGSLITPYRRKMQPARSCGRPAVTLAAACY